MNYLRHCSTLFVTLISLSAAACGGSQPAATQPAPAPAPAPTSSGAAAPETPDAGAPAAPEAHAEVRNGHIEISQMVEFQENSEALHQNSDTILQRVVAEIHAHPEIHHLRIEGHTDDLGNAQHNQQLSAGRAQSVARYLHEHGVTIQVDAQGFGATRPLCHEETPACRAQNRRVDFVIADGT
jgi:outer membrane protein OmpA-like peptidoglycan-associated protein